MGPSTNTERQGNPASHQGQQLEGLGETAFHRPDRRKRTLMRSIAHWAFPGDTRAQRRKKIKFLLVAAGLGFVLGILIIIFEWMKSF
jgi:hypothetical protein